MVITSPGTLLCVPEPPYFDLSTSLTVTSPAIAKGPGGSILRSLRLLIKRSCSGVTQGAPLSSAHPKAPLFQVLATSDTLASEFQPYSETLISPNLHFSLENDMKPTGFGQILITRQ